MSLIKRLLRILNEKGASKETIRNYRCNLQCFSLFCKKEGFPLEEAGFMALTQYKTYLQEKGKKNNTVNHKVRVAYRLLSLNCPGIKIRRPKTLPRTRKTRHLSDRQLEKAFSVSKRSLIDQNLVIFFFYSGLSLKKAITLRWENVSLGETSGELRECLLRFRKKNTNRVLPLGRSAIEKRMRRISRRCGFAVSADILRRTCILNKLLSGATVEEVSKMFGYTRKSVVKMVKGSHCD